MAHGLQIRANGININMKKLIYYSFLLFVSCEFYDRKLKIINEKTSEICYIITYDTLAGDRNNFAYYLRKSIPMNDSVNEINMSGQKGWKHSIERSKSGKLFMYVYSKDSLIKFATLYKDVNDLNSMRKYYRLYSYSLEELEKLNWTIIVQ